MSDVRFSLLSLFVGIAVLVLSLTLTAQSFPGRVTGTVMDASGAVVEGAEVKLSSPEIHLERSLITDATGLFNFASLPLGTFSLTITKENFKTYVQSGIVTAIERVNEIPVVLSPGSVDTKVEVTGAAPLVQTQTNTVGGDFIAEEVEQLPMGNGDYTRYAFLLPGVSTNTDYTFTQVAINGSPSRSVSFNIDGSLNMDAYRYNCAMNQGGNSYTAATRVPPDAISDVSVTTGGAADVAAGAGAVNIVLKSGTNAWHGTVYEQHRDASLTAHNFFENLSGVPKAHFIWNEYGGSIGGPIFKDKTFFFASYDGSRSVLGSSTTAFAPTAADIQTATNLLGGIGVTPNALGQTILGLYAPHSGQFTVSGVGSQTPDNFSVKIDQHLGANDLVTGRYIFGNGKDAFPQGSDSPGGGSQLQQYYGVTPVRPQNMAISENHTISTNFVNVFRVSYNHIRYLFTPADGSFNPSSIGLVTGAAPVNYGLPEIDLGAGVYENLGTNPSYPRGRTSETFQVNDDATHTHGKHNVQVGFDWEFNKVFGFNDSNFRGILTFDGSQEGNALAGEPGRVADLVDLLAGLPDPNSTNIARGATRFDLHQNVMGLYVNDTYQVTHKLTVLAGLRWDFLGVPQEDKGRFSNFSPTLGLVPVNGNIYQSDWHNFSPRVAITYSPFSHNGLDTVIRAGYGLYYVESPLDVLVGQTFNFTNKNPGLATNPVNGRGVFSAALASTPIETNVPIFSTSGVPTPPFNLIGIQPNLKPPYVQSWNLTLEQALAPDLMLQIGYVGTKGTHILGLPDINQPPPGQPNAAAEQTARPFYSQFPQFGQINMISSMNNSSYNALQVVLKSKQYHGLTMQFGYTWSHAIDEASETMDFYGTSGFVPKDSLNPRLNYADSEFDVPQAISVSYVYALPKFTDRAAMGQLINNWQLSGVVSWHNSMALPVLTYDDISGTGELHDVPDCTGPIVTQYKNFAIPAVVSGYSEPAFGTFGTCSRNSLPGPWLAQWDSSIAKRFPIGERFKMEFRMDAFNFLNHANFGNPSSVYGAEFVTGTADAVNNDSHFGMGAQREFQLNLKLIF